MNRWLPDKTCVLPHAFQHGKPVVSKVHGSRYTSTRQSGWFTNQASPHWTRIVATRSCSKMPAAWLGCWPGHHRTDRSADSIGDGFGTGFSRPLAWGSSRVIVPARRCKASLRCQAVISGSSFPWHSSDRTHLLQRPAGRCSGRRVARLQLAPEQPAIEGARFDDPPAATTARKVRLETALRGLADNRGVAESAFRQGVLDVHGGDVSTPSDEKKKFFSEGISQDGSLGNNGKRDSRPRLHGLHHRGGGSRLQPKARKWQSTGLTIEKLLTVC